MNTNILDMETLALDEEERALVIIDQTKLPNCAEYLHLKTQGEIWTAIHELQVRGAPAIGDAAAIGIYLAALEIDTDDYDEFARRFHTAADYLNSSRPTAGNHRFRAPHPAPRWDGIKDCTEYGAIAAQPSLTPSARVAAGMGRGEDERHVDADALLGEVVDRRERLLRGGELDHDVGGQRRQALGAGAQLGDEGLQPLHDAEGKGACGGIVEDVPRLELGRV